MRARDIKPGFFKNDQLAECSMAARLLFPGLWMLADREGRLENRPRKIKAEIFPFDDVDVAALLAELDRAGLIRTYEVNGTALVWIPQFKRHQSPHKNEKSSELPAHPDDISVTCPVQDKAKGESTPEMEGSAPEIPGKIPLTPSSLTPSSLSPRDKSPLTPHGGAGRTRKRVSGPDSLPALTEAIEAYTEDDGLREALGAYVAMRQKIRKPLTGQGLRLSLRELDRLAGDDVAQKIAIVEQSVQRSWQGLFALKPDSGGGQQDSGGDLLARMEASRREAKEAALRRAQENSPWGRVAQ